MFKRAGIEGPCYSCSLIIKRRGGITQVIGLAFYGVKTGPQTPGKRGGWGSGWGGGGGDSKKVQLIKVLVCLRSPPSPSRYASMQGAVNGLPKGLTHSTPSMSFFLWPKEIRLAPLGSGLQGSSAGPATGH